MPHFSTTGHDTYVCQQCGSVKCSGAHPPQRKLVPRMGRLGNLCPTCALDTRTNADADAKLLAQQLFGEQHQIYADACDVGVRIDGGRNEHIALAVRHLVLNHQPKITKWHNGRSYDFGGFEISWNRDTTRKIEFLSFTAK